MADSSQPVAAVDPSETLKNGIAKCKRKRKNLVYEWAINVDYARGKPFDQESDSDRVYVNVDNSMARRKAAQIASQLPEARLTPKKGKEQQVGPLLGQFAARLNDEIRKACIGDALFETAKDAINAAGFGAVLCGYEARTQMRKTLQPDPKTFTPDQQAGLQAAGQLEDDQAQELLGAYGISITEVPFVTSSRFYGDRISPSDFLWPLEFERSNFDKAPWLGHDGRMSWADAKVAFKLTDDEKEKVSNKRNASELNLRNDAGHSSDASEDIVEYSELFYWRAHFDPDEPCLDCIWRIVIIDGLDRTPVHGPWEGQKKRADGRYVGATKLPLRVLTLDYVSDDPIPPSDSAVSRPQINELIRSRTQMVQQRERSLPLRWHDVNRLDPLTSSNLTRGTWQASIPVKGDGSRVIGEVARANYPGEDFEFDRIIKSDVQESWGVDNNQLGMFASGRRTASEAKVVQANFATQTGFQRARVGAFFCGIAEVIAGLVALYGDDLPQPPAPQPPAAPQGPQGPPTPGAAPAAPVAPGASPAAAPQGPPPLDVREISTMFDYNVLPDSTVLLDANQRADQLMDTLNMVGKSGFVNPEPIIVEILQCKGIDPSRVMIQPDTKKEEPPNVSYRFSGEDMLNPMVVSFLMNGHLPNPQELQAAITLIKSAVAQTAGMQPTPAMPGGASTTPNPGGGGGPHPAMPPADARPEWQTMPTVNKRNDE